MVRKLLLESDEANLPQTLERRAFVRYPRRLDALWQFLGLSIQELTSGHVADISINGVRLLLDRSFSCNTTLMLRLPTITQGWSTHLVRVKRSVESGNGQFEIGCTFVRPLSAKQLQAFLQLS